MEKKDIAVTIQNFVQFYSIKNGIDELIKKNYSVDIYIPQANDNLGYGNMYDETYKELSKANYSIKRTTDNNISYKILLEPYPMDFCLKLNFQYRLKYKYSPIPAKPNLTCKPESNILYDAILCYGDYDAEYLKAYAATYVIGNLKYINFKKKTVSNNSKPVLLFLPTYGENSSILQLTDELKKLKDKYYIIVKSHHCTSSLNDELYRIDMLKDISDEYYDHSTQLTELLSKSDIVLSDNSGSIFESIYANVPVAIFSKDLNANKLGDFNTTQFDIVNEGFVPYTNNPLELSTILDNALSDSYKDKLSILRNKLFHFSQNPIEEFVSIIELFLNDKFNLKYKAIHDILINEYVANKKLINDLKLENSNNSIKINDLEAINLNNINEINSLKLEIDNNIKQIDLLKRDILSCKNELSTANSTILSYKDELNAANNTILSYKNELNTANSTISSCKDKLNDANRVIEYYEKGKLYKICKKIYKLYYKLFKKGSSNG